MYNKLKYETFSHAHCERIFSSTSNSKTHQSLPGKTRTRKKKTPTTTTKFHSLQTLVPGQRNPLAGLARPVPLTQKCCCCCCYSQRTILGPRVWQSVVISRRLVCLARVAVFLSSTISDALGRLIPSASACTLHLGPSSLPRRGFNDCQKIRRSGLEEKSPGHAVSLLLPSTRRRSVLQLLGDGGEVAQVKRYLHKVQHSRICVSSILARITRRKVIFSGVNYWLEGILARCLDGSCTSRVGSSQRYALQLESSL